MSEGRADTRPSRVNYPRRLQDALLIVAAEPDAVRHASYTLWHRLLADTSRRRVNYRKERIVRCSPFHTSEPETPAVYHNNSECSEGKKIKPEHRVSGEGSGRRLCEICAKLNAEGK